MENMISDISRSESGDHGETAVVLVDLQNDFCHADGIFAQNGLIARGIYELVSSVNELVAAADEVGRRVIWVKTVWDSRADVGILTNRSAFLRTGGLRRGTWGAELLEGLKVDEATHLTIEKKRFSSFFRTTLDVELDRLGVSQLVVGGVRTDICVESTIRDACFRDYSVIVPRECVGGYFAEFHENSLKLMSTLFANVTDVGDAIETVRAKR